MTAAIHPRASAVWFHDLHRWSVGAFAQTDWQWPAEQIKPLSAALSRKTIDVDRSASQRGELRLVTLHFDGEMAVANRMLPPTGSCDYNPSVRFGRQAARVRPRLGHRRLHSPPFLPTVQKRSLA
jgi:hypothetical protein